MTLRGVRRDDAHVTGQLARAEQVSRLIQLGLDRAAAELGAANDDTADNDLTGDAMTPLEQLDHLGPLLAGVASNITKDQLDDPTPCANFTVRGIFDHMVGGATMFAAAFRNSEPKTPASSDSFEAFGPALGDLVAAMQEPGALDHSIQAPFGEVPGDTFARFVVLDGLVHGWDLATATGQSYDPPNALVSDVTAFAQGALDPLRDGDTFAAATTPPSDATPIERLVALTGRQVVRA
jgi:uncharacterized protein (TIGR03086 family)